MKTCKPAFRTSAVVLALACIAIAADAPKLTFKFKTLRGFPKAQQTSMFGINNKGVVVGDYIDQNKIEHGVRWDPKSNKFTTIDDPKGDMGSECINLNSKGTIVGGYRTANQYRDAFQRFVIYIEKGARPLGVAVDAYGDAYIANNADNNIIAINVGFDLVETLTTDKSGFSFSSPGALAIHGRNIYAGFGPGSGENAVISYNVGEFLTSDPEEITVYNDNVNTGPTGIAFDSQNNVYISEFYSGTAVKYGPKGGSPLLVINQGTGGCEGIAVDKHGNIYVSNSSLNNITVYNSSGTLINTLN